MKHIHKKLSRRRPLHHASSKFKSWFAKSPLFASLAVLFALVALGGASYGAYNYLQSSDKSDGRSTTTVNQDQTSLEEGLPDIADDLADAKADTLKKASETKKDPDDPRAPTLTTGAGCVGVRCLKLGGFVITASPKTITVKAGEHFGPIKLRAADGRKADWGGMPEDGYVSGGNYIGVHTYGLTDFPGWSKGFDYYMESRIRAKGTYHLTFSATRKDEGIWAQTTVTVKVLPQPYFDVKVGTASQTQLGTMNIPINITRHNGHTGEVHASGKVTCPGKTTKTFYASTTGSQMLASVDISGLSLPAKCKMQLSTSGSNQNEDNPYTFKVQ